MYDTVTIFMALYPKCTTVSPFIPHAVYRVADIPLSTHQTNTCMTLLVNGFTAVSSPHGYMPYAQSSTRETRFLY